MIEQYVDRVYTESIVLDIGGEIGALIIYTDEAFRGREVEVCLKGQSKAKMIHTAVWERRFNGRRVFAGVFPALPEGDYVIWANPPDEVTITGGGIAEVDWQNKDVFPLPKFGYSHNHNFGTAFPSSSLENSLACNTASDILPPRYRDGRVVSAAPMGAAPLQYEDDGQVAWNEIWTGFCELALAGGPPHRGDLLEPVPPDEVRSNQEAYERVLAEIERGFRMVTGLPIVRSERLGWVGLKCETEEMALWMLRAIVVENVCIRREGTVLYLPAGPAFTLEKEIKNVITVVAKTYHYWTEHCLSQE